jgi:hypothetical protein
MGAAFQLIGRATNLKPPSLIGLFLCSCKRAASAAAFAAATASASAVVGVGSVYDSSAIMYSVSVV